MNWVGGVVGTVRAGAGSVRAAVLAGNASRTGTTGVEGRVGVTAEVKADRLPGLIMPDSLPSSA